MAYSNMKKNHCTMFFEGCWSDCCRMHDAAYKAGLPKVQSDIDLYKCVKAKRHRIIAVVMFLGVSTFGLVNYFMARVRAWK